MADLRSVTRLGVLHRQAAQAGLVAASPAGRLLIVSAAERALRVGSRNPCGLFAAVVRRGLWRHISQRDEDAALARLAKHQRNGVFALLPSAVDEMQPWAVCRNTGQRMTIPVAAAWRNSNENAQRVAESISSNENRLGTLAGIDAIEAIARLVERLAEARSMEHAGKQRSRSAPVSQSRLRDVA